MYYIYFESVDNVFLENIINVIRRTIIGNNFWIYYSIKNDSVVVGLRGEDDLNFIKNIYLETIDSEKVIFYEIAWDNFEYWLKLGTTKKLEMLAIVSV
ncbi:MAG: hypothetical protein P1P85_01560 [Patescibacteria group bacterium]|nr:hypothetical protein [Patescibacteria group bacterium]